MKVYQKERLENAICFFAYGHYKETKKYPSQTYIYKYLAFFEFQILEETGEAPLDLTYRAMKRGPVPLELYENRRGLKADCFCFEEKDENTILVRALKKPEMDYFSEYEIKKMNDLIYTFASSYMTAHIMSDSSHEKIKAWAKAWNRQQNSLIDKADTFDNIYKKKEDEMTPQEEHFLMSESFKKVGV